MVTVPWHDLFNSDEYEIVGVGRTWWDVTGMAADRLGVPLELRRENRPTGYKILKQDRPQVYADDSPDEAWIAFNAQALNAVRYTSHPSWGPGTPWVLLWRRATTAE